MFKLEEVSEWVVISGMKKPKHSRDRETRTNIFSEGDDMGKKMKTREFNENQRSWRSPGRGKKDSSEVICEYQDPGGTSVRRERRVQTDRELQANEGTKGTNEKEMEEQEHGRYLKYLIFPEKCVEKKNRLE